MAVLSWFLQVLGELQCSHHHEEKVSVLIEHHFLQLRRRQTEGTQPHAGVGRYIPLLPLNTLHALAFKLLSLSLQCQLFVRISCSLFFLGRTSVVEGSVCSFPFGCPREKVH